MRRLLPFVLLACIPSAADAKFMIQNVTANFDSGTGTYDFSVEFNNTLDFTEDAFGRQARVFQIDFGQLVVPLNFLERFSIVRGPELPESDPLIRVRKGVFAPDYDGFDPDPNSGGWGFVRVELPYDFTGTTFHFAPTLADLGQPGSEPLDWRVGTFEYGRGVDEWTSWSGHMAAVPEPSSVILAGVGALGLAAVARLRRRQCVA